MPTFSSASPISCAQSMMLSRFQMREASWFGALTAPVMREERRFRYGWSIDLTAEEGKVGERGGFRLR